MIIYLLRHGERGHGEQQDTLTENGIEQAKKAAQFFKKIKIDKIICGDSNRAKKTAEEILKETNFPIEYTSKVNEQEMGILQGKSGMEYKKALEESGLSKDEFRPIGGENSYDAFDRAKEFVEMLKNRKENTILIVSHSGFISNLIAILSGKTIGESNFKTDFCSITYLEIDHDLKIKRIKCNDTGHLN